MKKLVLLLALVSCLVAVRAEDAKAAASAAPKLKQWIYVLRLIPRLHDDKAWTDADKQIVGGHFAHLQAAVKEGKVVLGGRTQESGDKTFGIVIFEAADEAAARAFMQSDPAVANGIMVGTVHPFGIALQRKG